MIIHGDNIIFNTSTSAIFGAKSGTLDVQADTIEIASPTQGSWREFIAGRKEWSLSVNHLVGIDATQSGIPSAIQMVGQSFTIYITLRDTNERISCTGICTSWKLTATKGNLAQGGFTFKGTGGFTP